MKKFWQWLFGPLNSPTRKKWVKFGRFCLLPGFFLLLLWLFFCDLLSYFLELIDHYFSDKSSKIIVFVEKMPAPELFKKIVKIILPWLGTFVLFCLIILFILLPRQVEVVALTNADQTLTEKIIVEKILPLPKEIRFASDSAVIKLTENELLEWQKKLQQINGEEATKMSQQEQINIALINYYLGDEQNYQKWLQLAKKADPNEAFFIKN